MGREWAVVGKTRRCDYGATKFLPRETIFKGHEKAFLDWEKHKGVMPDNAMLRRFCSQTSQCLFRARYRSGWDGIPA